MKNIIFLSVIIGVTLVSGCSKSNNSSAAPNHSATADTTKDDISGHDDTNHSSNTFAIQNIPISTHQFGEFPFFNLPAGLITTNPPIQRKYDIVYFPINGVMTPIEGRVWKSHISLEKPENGDWSLPYFLKSYDDAVTAVGGKKIFDGKITDQEYKRYHDQAPYLGEDGSIGYADQDIRVYIIRRPDGDDIYLQLTGDTASGRVNILQEKPFKQTITLLQSEEIQQQLEDTGKAILYINFDSNKATLKPEGMVSIQEIKEVLDKDPQLKLEIQGYTDDIGSAEHNQRLSQARAEAVKNELVRANISSDRLQATGFGQTKPIADNQTEQGKAKNRRVELVKLNAD
ncbi:OmpA family protein [Acinetobacter vivianii]|uniref:OmpA family protein n=1 Tax=Acinetobacter vivianii TaxID=1776742 RepID=UPI0040424611